jgi:L-ascorbate metabolism protein UlaG (beta-lactamase superfamily)
MKRIMYISFTSLFFLSLLSYIVLGRTSFGKLPKGERLERIKQSLNYKDGEFQNQSPTPTFTGEDNQITAIYKFLFGKKERVTPLDSIPVIKTNLASLDPRKDVLVWLGHSSYFIQIDGKRILVDPVLNDHASPFSWMIKAFKGSDAYKAENIPDIDYLFITHDHWDHLDYETIMKIKPRIKKVICGLGVGSYFEYWGFNPASITELDWYGHTDLDKNWIATATPARHFSGRGLKRNKTLWASFVLQTPSMKIFIGGDGGYDKHFKEIGNKFGPIDLAILEQGQYDQRWKYIHLLPEQVFQAALDLKAKNLLPVHNSKFALAAHHWDEPLNKLAENSEHYNIRALTPMIGEPVNLQDSTQQFSQWWKKLK